MPDDKELDLSQLQKIEGEKVEGVKPETTVVETADEKLKKFESLLGKVSSENDELKRRLAGFEETRKRETWEDKWKALTTPPPTEQPEPQRYQERPPEQKPGLGEFDYYNPVDSIEKIVSKRLESELTKREKTNQENQKRAYYEVGQSNFVRGYQGAVKTNPDLFKGIDEVIAGSILESFRAGKLGANDLGNPDIWESLAVAYRWKNDRDYFKGGGGIQGMANVGGTATPAQVKAPEAKPVVSDSELESPSLRAIIDNLPSVGGSLEKAKELIEYERKQGQG